MGRQTLFEFLSYLLGAAEDRDKETLPLTCGGSQSGQREKVKTAALGVRGTLKEKGLWSWFSTLSEHWIDLERFTNY